jgi:predicted NBD/HSP70 family sugar kinase
MGGDTEKTAESIIEHGAAKLPTVIVESYNIEIRDADGFIGDRANKQAFLDILDTARKLEREASGRDPIGKDDTDDISKKEIDQFLISGEPHAAAIVMTAIEEFAQELAGVVKRFIKAKAWRDIERIAVGGGMRQSRAGEIAIHRAGLLLHNETDIELVPIRHHPDEAGLLGVVQLAPPWVFRGHDAILAVDIGGTNIRVGVVELNQKKSPTLEKAKLWKSILWRHADDKIKRDAAVEELADMLKKMIVSAKKAKLELAPFIGIGCPGVIERDGAIERGAQNLPGDWSGKNFHLPQELRSLIPTIEGQETTILMHNDAVVQGLSQVAFMRDIDNWGVLTIGTGLGNARFTNRETSRPAKT